MQAGDCFKEFVLYSSNDKFIIKPYDPDQQQAIGPECLVINRETRDIFVEADPQIPENAAVKSPQTPKTIYGIFGIIRLIYGPYLIVITKREKVATINNRNVYRVVATEMYPYATTSHLNEAQVADNRTLVNMMEMVLALKSFYFATDFDVTHSLQRVADMSPEMIQSPLHERADQRFVWNQFMLRDLKHTPGANRFIMPVMLGFVEARQCVEAGRTIQLILISRRSCRRAGVRFEKRGVDDEGNAANFVETEQILECGDFICSFVQTRGSIPLSWSQKPNLHWWPWPKLIADDRGFRRHMEEQVSKYGNVRAVNLVNMRGRETTVGLALRDAMQRNPHQHFKLVEFDFHRAGFRRVAHWVSNDLAGDCATYGFFCMRRDGQLPQVVQRQTGVFRTNCMDCLDRTNVVQSMLAKRVRTQQLQKIQDLLGDVNFAGLFANSVNFERHFNDLWADHGDTCSVQYAGTGAMKADVTRTGARTCRGRFNDVKKALTRYYINNFHDGYRQDAMDLFVGNYVVDEQNVKGGLFKKHWSVFGWFGVAAILSGLLGLTSILKLFSGGEHNGTFMLVWFGLLVIVLGKIWIHGEKHVDKPSLKQD